MADAQIYAAQAAAVREGGLDALRDLAAEYAEEPKLHAFPSPIRWLWVWAVAVFGARLPQVSAFLACAVCVWLVPSHGIALGVILALSPLVHILKRNLLQDTTVAALTLASAAFASRGSPLLALSLLALAAVKETGWLTVPALGWLWWFSGAPMSPFGVSVVAAAASWVLLTRIFIGPSALNVLRKAMGGHQTPYTRDHQSGAPHRLLVDLALLSPVPFLLAVSAAPKLPGLAGAAVLLLAAHAVSPVRNVRTVLAAELMVRSLAAVALMAVPLPYMLPVLAASVALDLLVIAKTRDVYDPVTGVLASALGMQPKQ